MKKPPILYWFRNDLRLSDNPALCAAAKEGEVLPIYIWNSGGGSVTKRGAASRYWLYHSLKMLKAELGSFLSFYKGDELGNLECIIQQFGIKKVFWNRCYEPHAMKRDKVIKETLKKKGIDVQTFNASLLWEPWEAVKAEKDPYKVFTPFYRKGCLSAPTPRKPLNKPSSLKCVSDKKNGWNIDDLDICLPKSWHAKFPGEFKIGEVGAKERLNLFIKRGLDGYKEQRNFPALPHVSKLSPHIHHGEISPNQIYYSAKKQGDNSDVDHFCSELGWREFSYNLLYFNQDLEKVNIQKKFNNFSWKKDTKNLHFWQKGQTGIPFVDAGMRELYTTGFLHNRMRMVVGSFLVKNLMIHWHEGRKWFWDCLFDADLANNSASWQWIAGCGADAAPYFRIFNPITQGQKFDGEGIYTKQYLPELANLPNKYLFDPWNAPESVLDQAGVKLGKTYPKPIVDLSQSRLEALEAFSKLKGL